MSVEKVYEFFVSLIDDDALNDELEKKFSGKDNEEADRIISEAGRARGFEFSPEEAAIARASIRSSLANDIPAEDAPLDVKLSSAEEELLHSNTKRLLRSGRPPPIPEDILRTKPKIG